MLHFYPSLRSEYRLLLRPVHSAEPHGDSSLPSKCIQPSWPSDASCCPVLAAKGESVRNAMPQHFWLALAQVGWLAGVPLVLHPIPCKSWRALAKTAPLHPKLQYFLLRNSSSNWLHPVPDSDFYQDVCTRRLPTLMLWWQKGGVPQ